jgi:hypothetical protein
MISPIEPVNFLRGALHEAAHSAKLADLVFVTTSTRVRHDVDRVESALVLRRAKSIRSLRHRRPLPASRSEITLLVTFFVGQVAVCEVLVDLGEANAAA